MGQSWGPLGAFLGRFEASWAVLELYCAVLGPSWPSGGSLGAVLEPSSGLLTPSWVPPETLLGQFEALSQAVFKPSWDFLRPSWTLLGSFWHCLGPSWGLLGGLLGRLELTEAGKPEVSSRPPGGSLGALLSRPWGLSEPS